MASVARVDRVVGLARHSSAYVTSPDSWKRKIRTCYTKNVRTQAKEIVAAKEISLAFLNKTI